MITVLVNINSCDRFVCGKSWKELRCHKCPRFLSLRVFVFSLLQLKSSHVEAMSIHERTIADLRATCAELQATNNERCAKLVEMEEAHKVVVRRNMKAWSSLRAMLAKFLRLMFFLFFFVQYCTTSLIEGQQSAAELAQLWSKELILIKEYTDSERGPGFPRKICTSKREYNKKMIELKTGQKEKKPQTKYEKQNKRCLYLGYRIGLWPFGSAVLLFRRFWIEGHVQSVIHVG